MEDASMNQRVHSWVEDGAPSKHRAVGVQQANATDCKHHVAKNRKTEKLVAIEAEANSHQLPVEKADLLEQQMRRIIGALLPILTSTGPGPGVGDRWLTGQTADLRVLVRFPAVVQPMIRCHDYSNIISNIKRSNTPPRCDFPEVNIKLKQLPAGGPDVYSPPFTFHFHVQLQPFSFVTIFFIFSRRTEVNTPPHSGLSGFDAAF